MDKEGKSTGPKGFTTTLIYALLALLCSAAFTAVTFWFDYWLQDMLGRVNSYAYLLFALLSALACYFLVSKNPQCVWYVPIIITIPFIIPIFVGDFDPMMSFIWIFTALASWLGYRRAVRKGIR